MHDTTSNHTVSTACAQVTSRSHTEGFASRAPPSNGLAVFRPFVTRLGSWDYTCNSHTADWMIAPKHLRKLMMGGGDELEYQNIPEEGGQKRKDMGVGQRTSTV